VNKQNVVAVTARLAHSIQETAGVIGIGRTKLLELMKAGDGPPSFKLGRRRLIRHEELDTWLAMCGDRWGSDTLHREDDVV
jgi:excisionase family DNA binding protein